MPNEFQTKSAIDRTIHSHRLDHIRYSLTPAGRTGRRPQQIVQAVKMDEVESHEGSLAESYHTGIDRESAIMAEGGEIDRFDAVLFGAPAPFATLEIRAQAVVRGEAEVRRQNRHVMPALDESASEGSNLDDGSAFSWNG